MIGLGFFMSMISFSTAYTDEVFVPTRSVYLDKGKDVVFGWAYNGDDAIKIEVTMPGSGWIGIGFSPSGTMKGADVIMAWMSNGVARVLDMHATGNGLPLLDHTQNLRQYRLKHNETHSTLFIDRFLDTCDELHDFAITEDTTRVIFAYGSNSPEGGLPTFANKHADLHRGVKSLRLLDNKLPVLHVEDDDNLKYFDIRTAPFKIPRKKTYYLCSYHKLPEFTEKQHIVQFDVMITPGNEKNVHHITVYHCNESMLTDEMLKTRGECYINDEGGHWKYCSPVVVAWAVGMTEITMPKHVGFPIGIPGSPKIVKVEIHYDNYDLDEDKIDTSGIRVFHTPKLRQFDAGILMTGHDVDPTLLVPPGSKDFVVHGHCTSQCLAGILKQGSVSEINAFGAFLHSHTAGQKMVLRHFRNGMELKPIAKDLTYDFDYQELKFLRKEKEIQSGDNIIMECVYNTTDRSRVTTAGLSTRSEMCFGFIMYYPKIGDAFCQASPTASNMIKYFGVKNFYEAYTSAQTKKWTDHTRQQFNEIQLSAPIVELCRTISGPIKGLTEPYPVPVIKQKYLEIRDRCEIKKEPEKVPGIEQTRELKKKVFQSFQRKQPDGRT